MEKLRKKFRNARSLEKFIDKTDGVTAAARRLKVDRRTLYTFRCELGLI